MIRQEITNDPDFILLEEPIRVGKDCVILGGFPYEKASLYGPVKLPRNAAMYIAASLANLPSSHPLLGNKVVIVCRDLVNFGTEDFAVFLKDAFCTFGRWEDIKKY